ncbi:MAG TPA: patatin-like phospholipase family protein [Ignavibacteria bacterium]
MPEDNLNIGVAFSGGGFRAAAFHLGTLKKLKELGVLDKVHVLSTISGGSLAGAFYMLHKNNFDEFTRLLENALQVSVVKKVLFSKRFLTFAFSLLIIWVVPFFLISVPWALFSFLVTAIIALIFLYSFIPLSDLVEQAYNKVFFEKKKLSDFPEEPIITINSTNLETGGLFTFSKEYMGDSNYEHNLKGGKPVFFKVLDFPVSVAVSASTAIPFPFNPIKIKQKHYSDPKDFPKRADPSLVDGGVYDNQGIHKITNKMSRYKCDTIICSDAAAPFKRKFYQMNPLPILTRVNSIMMLRIKNLQKSMNVYGKSSGLMKEIAYYSIDWNYEDCIDGFIKNLSGGELRENVAKAHNIPEEYYTNPNDFKEQEIKDFITQKINYKEIIKNGLTAEEINKISGIKTGLSPLTKDKLDLLSRHASVLTEIQVRLYCPSLFINP